MRKNIWKIHEDELITKYYPENGLSFDRWWFNGGDLLEGRSKSAVGNRACKLGVQCIYHGPKTWRRDQDRLALMMLARLCKETGKTPVACVRRLEHLTQQHMMRLRADRLGVS